MRSEELKNKKWYDGWKSFCESEKEKYLKCIRRAAREDSSYEENHNFAHYLDCEAHLDVIRELFPTANMTNVKFKTAIMAPSKGENPEILKKQFD